jgi:hypothetical protein
MSTKRNIRKQRLLLIAVLFFLFGCRLMDAAATSNSATQTALASAIIQYSTSAGGRFPSPTRTVQGARPDTPTATLTPPPTDTPTATSTLTPTSTSTIAHAATPPGTSGTTRYITDPETRDYAPQKKSPGGSDFYQNNRYERPYTAETMEYLPDVDLTRVEMRITPPWVFITFFISGARAEGIGKTMYGAEFDINRDGRGEFLIWGASPPDAEWTTEGVAVWKDSNADVGGPNPQMTNAPWTGGNGYDQEIFLGGRGMDPDLAWIRQAEGGKKVQLAFKYSAIGNAPQFLWNGLADFGVRRPDWFDYNDHFTQGEAGSPLPVQADFYPLKSLYGIDNTCRDAYGFTPTGTEPNLCQYFGSISGVVGWDIDHDGVLSPFELTHSMIDGDTVTLGQGACSTAGYKTAVTNSEGKYSFPNLLIGTYCVGLIHTVPVPLSITPVTAVLTPGENETVNFVILW